MSGYILRNLGEWRDKSEKLLKATRSGTCSTIERRSRREKGEYQKRAARMKGLSMRQNLN